jgi:molybdate transport system substrate-binding protein
MKSAKMKFSIIFLSLLSIAVFICSCSNKTTNNLKVYAAAGTMLPVNEICDSFEKSYHIKVDKNFAASGLLARQLNAGAEADIFISANKQWIDYLKANKLIEENAIKIFASNKLVLICPINKNIDIDFTKNFDIKLAINDKISIGDPTYVPVGKYAKQMLDSLNWFNKIQEKIILAKDVTSVLHYVELGECNWGIVYYSEALKSDKVKIAYEIPQNLYSPIIFYIGLLNENERSIQFMNCLKRASSKNILTKNGFNIEKLD